MINIPNEIVPYAFLFIFLIFLLALRKKKYENNSIEKDKIAVTQVQNKKEVLQEAEIKLMALKDLYRQELIDGKIYLNKTELIASKISKEIGSDIMELPKMHQKIIFNDLKQEIKKKINDGNTKNVKTNIDNLISAVDNKIKDGAINEKK